MTRKQALWATRLTIVLLVLVGLLTLIILRLEISLADLVNDATVWDWVKSLILPAVVAVFGTVGAAWFTRQRAQETALQAYLDKMSELLTDKDLHKKGDPYDDMRVTARARTLTILRQLDGGRKRIVLLFLRESRLINSKARCRRGHLVAHARLVGLEDADLKYADLRGARLISTSRREAVSLEGANLEGADLVDADLERADLRKVVLKRADLRGIRLVGADLRDAVLRGAVGVTNEELHQQAGYLAGATMPDGQKYETWLETNKYRREVHDAILETTWALVAEQGLLSVTMSQIAKKTGIGRATLYKYFPDVEAILLAWYEYHVSGHLERLAEIRDQAGDASERLEAVLEAYALISHEHHDIELGAELVGLLHRDQHVTGAQQQLRDMIGDLLAEAAKCGEVRDDVAPEGLASYCLHALAAASSLPSKTAVHRLVTVTLAGLHPRADSFWMPLEPATLLNVRVKITSWARVWKSRARALLVTERADTRGSGSRRSAQGRLRAGRDAGDCAGGTGYENRSEGGGLRGHD